MARKQVLYNTKGMNRDTSVYMFNSEFAFENRNLRLSTNEGNTFMSWTNEKGTAEIDVKILVNPWEDDSTKYIYNSWINGVPIGTAVIDHNLVLFTTDPHASMNDHDRDYIYSLHYTDDKYLNMEGKLLYKGNLNFQVDHPLETLVYEETSDIEKVYWTDGLNQPRLINIKASDSKLKKWNTSHTETPVNTDNTKTTDNTETTETTKTTNNKDIVDTFFDFVPSIKTDETFTVTKNKSGSGIFAPGVIQYCFTYLNKYGQQSNIVAVSPLYYLAHNDRGASPEDKISNSFTININNIDKNFDYIRLYSMQRTSYNGDVFAKHLIDIPTSEAKPKKSFSRELQYSEDSTLNLPLVDGKKVLTAVVNNGEYSVDVHPVKDSKGNDISWDNRQQINNIVSYKKNEDGSPYSIKRIMSFQDFINKVYYGSLGVPSDYIIKDYHISIHISREIDESLGEKVMGADNAYYGIEIDSGIKTLDIDLYNKYIIYNYADNIWYLAEADATDTVKKNEVTDDDNYVTYTDNGTTGSTVDPMELLYVGGKDISAYTMMDKDNTLFLGNIAQKNTIVTNIQEYFNELREENPNTHIVNFDTKSDENVDKTLHVENTDSIYAYTNELSKNQSQITTFKGGEKYRFGFQLQKYTGEWLEPIWLEDRLNTLYPATKFGDDNTINTVNLVYAKATIEEKVMEAIKEKFTDFDKVFRRIRPVIVFPSIEDRNVLCQGVLNPTVFNVEDRTNSSPFSQASWYFRPYMWDVTEAPTQSADNTATTYIKVNRSHWILDKNTIGGNILVASVTSDNFHKIIQKRSITLRHIVDETNNENPSLGKSTDESKEYSFYACIPLVDELYAFISNKNWIEDGIVRDDDTYYGHEYEEFRYEELSNIELSRQTIDFTRDYSDARYTDQLIPYFTRNPKPVELVFDTGNYQYIIVFTSVGEKLDTSINSSSNGNSIRFKHYDSLYTTSEFESDLKNEENTMYAIKDKAKNIEIEGSIKKYESPFSQESIIPNSKGNTQFFIDQSIVTLNSPDIEFDTKVQNYSLEGLKLRIVGAIPITANISAHSILRNSPMLEKKHNDGASEAIYGYGELNYNVRNNNISINAGRRLVSDYLWDDVHVSASTNKDNPKDNVKSSSESYDFLVYPWQRTGSLNDDTRSSDVASSLLMTKKESNLLFSIQSKYFDNNNDVDYNNINAQIALTENNSVMNYRLPKQKVTSSDINYYPNIDKALVNGGTYKILSVYGTGSNKISELKDTSSPVAMKYKSTSHAVIALNAKENSDDPIPILPYGIFNKDSIGEYTNSESTTTFWGDTHISFTQSKIDLNNLFNNERYNFLWIGELYRDETNRVMFGGDSNAALRDNKWLIGGEAVDLKDKNGQPKESVDLYWTNGDTYYQRYDCLKTYAYTKDDLNQLVEILSFMCETHVNIDGRYDRNRGQINNLNMSPVNFNLFNPVYNQPDNFFTYKKAITEDINKLEYKNQIYYSKTKESGADVDMYTNISLGSVLEMDGDKGPVNAIRRLNNNLIVFQDTGIAQILYNESNQISTQAGVPIEITNSGKVQGKRYITDTIGCSNKWAMVNTLSGIYFMDNINKGIYLYNGQLQSLSVSNGFNSWCKMNMPNFGDVWNPYRFNNFVAYYDRKNQDILFINDNIALAYSEKLAAFTSFYDYGGIPYFINLDSTGIWTKYTITQGEIEDISSDTSKPNKMPVPRKSSGAKPNVSDGDSTNTDSTNTEDKSMYITKLYSHNAGEYNKFFNEYKPYWTILVCNPEPLESKVFTNVEFQSIMENDGTDNKESFKFNTPFSKIEVWNDYQHGINALKSQDNKPYLHNTSDNSTVLNRKFRLWRCDVPRDNAHIEDDNHLIKEGYSVTREKPRAFDWIRNTWMYMKLYKGFSEDELVNNKLVNNKVQIHGIKLTYFV